MNIYYNRLVYHSVMFYFYYGVIKYYYTLICAENFNKPHSICFLCSKNS